VDAAAGFVQGNVDAAQHEGMSRGEQGGAALGGLDTCDTGYGNHIAFPVPAGLDECERLFSHTYPGLGTRLARRFRFVSDIDHDGRTRVSIWVTNGVQGKLTSLTLCPSVKTLNNTTPTLSRPLQGGRVCRPECRGTEVHPGNLSIGLTG